MRILHEGHLGMSRMKSLARVVVWWPGMDVDLENLAGRCQPCQVNRKSPPWSRLHVDFAGPFLGKTFIVLVDTHSKWPEITTVPSTSSKHAIEFLHCAFARAT